VHQQCFAHHTWHVNSSSTVSGSLHDRRVHCSVVWEQSCTRQVCSPPVRERIFLWFLVYLWLKFD
jgi:hypothetical protein